MSTEKLPETVAEAVQHLLSLLDEENQNALKNMERGDLIRLHMSYGMGIRNSLGLWGSNPKLCTDPEIAGMHPDSASIYIIERMWDFLNSRQDD